LGEASAFDIESLWIANNEQNIANSNEDFVGSKNSNLLPRQTNRGLIYWALPYLGNLAFQSRPIRSSQIKAIIGKNCFKIKT
jgi:hypothetical protein